MDKKVVKLASPIEVFGKTLRELEIREPTGREFMTNGEPRALVYSPGGSGYFIEQAEIIAKYCEKCIVSELGNDIFSLLSLEDAKAVKETVLSFFSAADARRAAKNSTS